MPVSAKNVLPPKPALRARMWRFGYWATRATLRAFSTAVAPLTAGKKNVKTGQLLKPAAELGLVAESAFADRDSARRLTRRTRIRAHRISST